MASSSSKRADAGPVTALFQGLQIHPKAAGDARVRSASCREPSLGLACDLFGRRSIRLWPCASQAQPQRQNRLRRRNVAKGLRYSGKWASASRRPQLAHCCPGSGLGMVYLPSLKRRALTSAIARQRLPRCRLDLQAPEKISRSAGSECRCRPESEA